MRRAKQRCCWCPFFCEFRYKSADKMFYFAAWFPFGERQEGIGPSCFFFKLPVKIFCVVASGCFECFGVVSHGGKAAKVNCCRDKLPAG